MTNSPFKTFKTDEAREKDGVWVDYDGYGFLVRRVGPQNKAYGKLLEKLMRPHAAAVRRGAMNDEKADEIMREVVAKTVLVNWRTSVTEGEGTKAKTTHTVGKLPGEDGTPIDFSVANAIALFKQLPDLFSDLYERAQDAAMFKSYDEEDTAGK